jgi:ATP-dependent Clp protease ATP-binding subunit ClpA
MHGPGKRAFPSRPVWNRRDREHIMLSKDLELMLGTAAREAHLRHHEYLSLEHLLFAVINHREGTKLIKACGGRPERLKSRIENFFKTHLEERPAASPFDGPQPTLAVQRVLQLTLMHIQSAGKEQAEIGDLVVAIMTEEDSYAGYFLKQEGITRLDVLDYVSHGISKYEADESVVPSGEGCSSGAEKQEKATGHRSALEAFTVNLIQRAAEGGIDPLVGRTVELERTMQVLCRRRKNNPIYVGEPGVGKTALAEGLALKISRGEVPEPLEHTAMYALDLGALLAGTKYRGEFESRLKEVILQLKNTPRAILFIDEIHTIVGAGATSGGSMDASNILKPALASGTLKCIGSTTYEEYRTFFDKDRALSRRFQRIELHEPSVAETIQILKGLKGHYEKHHRVRYTMDALKSAAELSARYITDRYLPDKAIDVIDEAASVLRLSAPGSNGPRLVTTRHVENVVAKTARVPINAIKRSELSRLEDLETSIKAMVFGQDEAVETVTKAIKRSRAGLSHPERPIGSFLFMGPTGVGKTELARQTAAILGVHFQRFDMSEYMEKHAVARLIGAPPGYVGFDQGGLLTEAIRKHPYCVLLLDEIEKAHPDLFSILLQVMDHATLTDNTGKKADFRHVILFMTSNAGAREMESRSIGFGGSGAQETVHKGEEAVRRLFSPEFRNRLDAVVPFSPLNKSTMERIVEKMLTEVKEQLFGKRLRLETTPTARSWLATQGYDPQFGARPLSRLIQTEIKDPLAEAILSGRFKKGDLVVIDVGGERLVVRRGSAKK